MISRLKIWFLELALAAVLVVAVLWHPMLAAAGIFCFFAVALGVRVQSKLPELFLGLLGICVVGYAFMGRGFAYLGYPPLYIGEVTLAIGLLALLLKGGSGVVFRSPTTWLLLIFMGIGAANTFPYLGTYGIDALRDAVIWGYGIFVVLVAAFLLRTNLLMSVVKHYERFLPWFLFWTPVAFVAQQIAGDIIPRWPGSNVPLINIKPGDASVHLAGILVFVVLGLHRAALPRSRAALWLREWFWWIAWFISAGLTFAVNRGGMLSVMLAAMLLMALRPLSRWGKFVLIGLLLGSIFVASGIEIRLSNRRPISAEYLWLNIQTIFSSTEEAGDRSGTAEWRLNWWNDIIDYTIYGPYFWTGKGYGINLALDDGYQGHAFGLRSPHNGHITVLARSGVPGALLWALLQAVFALSMLRAFFRARRTGQVWWAKLNLWILCYWLAFMVNGAFDVFLEGPQGGIWFWSLIGFGLAALEAQRRGDMPPDHLTAAKPHLNKSSNAVLS